MAETKTGSVSEENWFDFEEAHLDREQRREVCLDTSKTRSEEERIAMIVAYQESMSEYHERMAPSILRKRTYSTDSLRLCEATRTYLANRASEAVRELKRRADRMVQDQIEEKRRREGRWGPFFRDGKVKPHVSPIDIFEDTSPPPPPYKSPSLVCYEEIEEGDSDTDWNKPLSIPSEISEPNEEELRIVREWSASVDERENLRVRLREARLAYARQCAKTLQLRNRLNAHYSTLEAMRATDWEGVEEPWSDGRHSTLSRSDMFDMFADVSEGDSDRDGDVVTEKKSS